MFLGHLSALLSTDNVNTRPRRRGGGAGRIAWTARLPPGVNQRVVLGDGSSRPEELGHDFIVYYPAVSVGNRELAARSAAAGERGRHF